MAGVRRRKNRKGVFLPKYEGWYINHSGKQSFFTGTTSKSETLKIARQLERDHKDVRLGIRPVPRRSDRLRRFDDVLHEYLAWGRAEGGAKGKPWEATTARPRESQLKFWSKELGLEYLNDIVGSLPRVEAVLRRLVDTGRSAGTRNQYAISLKAFCRWATTRAYFERHPLETLNTRTTGTKRRRRALTKEELQRVLACCEPHMALLYELACCSGLRRNELRGLTVRHLDSLRCGIYLDEEITKNSRSGFQPLPRWLVDRLAKFGESGEAAKIYEMHRKKSAGKRVWGNDADPLVYVPSATAEAFYGDLRKAGLPKETDDGIADFHSLRNAYATYVMEAGASVKEATDLVRHSNARLTLETYARSRHHRLQEIAEHVGEGVENHGTGMAQAALEGTSGQRIPVVSNDVRECDGGTFASTCSPSRGLSSCRPRPGRPRWVRGGRSRPGRR